MKYVVAASFLVIGIPIALTGLAFVFNVRDVGVRYVRWYRENWAWTRGIAALQTPRATRVTAGLWGLLWFVCDGGITILVAHRLLT